MPPITKNQSQRKWPTLTCIAPFNNPHIVPFYNEVSNSARFCTTLVNLHPISEARKKLGWLEMETNNGWLQPWRSNRDRLQFFWKLVTSDLVVFPGFFHTRTLPAYHLLRKFRFGKSILWSEPFLDHPSVIDEPSLKRIARKIMLKPFNHKNYQFLAMGEGADKDYLEVGMNHWDYYQFLFTVETEIKSSGKLSPSNGGKKIVFCGSLTKRKGVDVLIEALAGLEDDCFSYELTIVGDGPERSNLERLAQQSGVANNIRFIGSKPVNQVNKILKQQDLLVLPSRYDGWRAVINEAMACSLAVIASDKVGSRKPLIKNGYNGFTFKSESPKDLREKLLKTLSNENTLAKFKLESRRRALLFSPASVSTKFLDFCETIIKNERYFTEDEILANLNDQLQI